MASAKEKKALYMEKFVSTFQKYTQLLVVSCDNIGSAHMMKIRKELRGKAVVLMGKNTLMRKAIRSNLEQNPSWGVLLPHIVGNIGLVFANEDLNGVRKVLLASRVPAAAKIGAPAPQDVVIPKGQTTLEPTKTSFLQALNIASKINKGTIEIVNDVKLITAGDKVGPSEAQLLQMLGIRPFTYGLNVLTVFDAGSVYDAEILDLSDDVLLQRFQAGVANVAAVSLAANVPSVAAFPHAVVNGYLNLLAVALGTDYSFPRADKVKEMLKNPGAFAPAPAAAAPAAKKEEAKKEEPKKEEKPESDDMGFDLFG
jgi:large subunit ribosomal protein LP0